MTTPNKGGYQPPTNPAPVSGPGKLSKRTDGKQPMRQLPDAAYGEQATFQDAQRAGPMDAAPSAPGPGQIQPVDTSHITPLGDPTQRPGEPVTAGAQAGPGPGPAALGLGNSADDPAFRNLVGMLPSLELMANSAAAGPAFKQFVRRVRAMR